MQLLTCTTLTEYTEIKTKLEQLSELVPSLEGWLQWWFARRYNLFSHFQRLLFVITKFGRNWTLNIKEEKAIDVG